MKVLPFRFKLLKTLDSKNKALEPAELYEMVKDIYPNEKQCTVKAIDEHLMSMRGVGLVEVKDAYENSNKEIISRYQLAEYGKEKVKQYIK